MAEENPFLEYSNFAWIESGKGAEDGLDYFAEMGDGGDLGHFATLQEARDAIKNEALARGTRVQIKHLRSLGDSATVEDDEEVGVDPQE